MGHTGSCRCVGDGVSRCPNTGRKRRRIWWHKHTPFGPEPKHDKSVSWLNNELGQISESKVHSDYDEKYSELKEEEENGDCFGGDSRSSAHIPKALSIVISLENVNGDQGAASTLDLPVEVKPLQKLNSEQDFSSEEALLSGQSVKTVTRSRSASLFQETKFSSIRNSAMNFIVDLDEFRKELNKPEVAESSSGLLPPELLEFRKNVLNLSPSDDQMHPQKFLSSFLPILSREPKCFQPLLTLDFDVFDVSSLPEPFNAMPLVATTLAVLSRLKTLEQLRISPITLVKFLINVEEGYHNLPFHSKWHAADVVANLGYYLNRGWFRKVLNPVHQLISIMAAASHDLGHDGQTNQFHRLAKTPIGVSYPESNLEYHHIAKSMGVRNIKGCDWPAELSLEDDRLTSDEIWTLFSTLILRTDPAMHNPNKKPFSGIAKGTTEEKKLALIPALMEIFQLADISNCVKPIRIAKKWATRFYLEFVDIGKESRRLKLNIPVFNVESKMPSLPDTQIFFSSKVCLPKYNDLCIFLPEVLETVYNLEQNLTYWNVQKSKLIQKNIDTNASPKSLLPTNSLGNDFSVCKRSRCANCKCCR